MFTNRSQSSRLSSKPNRNAPSLTAFPCEKNSLKKKKITFQTENCNYKLTTTFFSIFDNKFEHGKRTERNDCYGTWINKFWYGPGNPMSQSSATLTSSSRGNVSKPESPRVHERTACINCQWENPLFSSRLSL